MSTPSPSRRGPASVSALFSRWRAWPEERRDVIIVVLLAAAVFLPWLGSLGLWDPWEPHYAEVARQMIVRDDYVHPYWENAYFFSKPVLLLWMDAFALNLIGVHKWALPFGADPNSATPSGLSIYTEWAVRLPTALLAIMACALVFVAVKRLVSRRAGYFSVAALITMPFYFLLARQAITDTPFVSLLTSGTMCFAIALWDERAHTRAWAYAGYIFLAFATLAKGLLGFGITGGAFLLWFALTGEWRRITRLYLVEKVRGLSLPIGPVIFLAIAAPWYLVMSFFTGVDDESQTFAYRFWIHDHFKRLGEGVHTTTPGGTFEYFIRQLGYGLFPWVAAIPGALVQLARVKLRERSRRDDLLLLCGLWAGLVYTLMTFSATKFHHYIFPAVPAIAVLCGLFLDKLFEEGVETHAMAVLLGFVAFAVVAHSLWMEPKALPELFVYNYDRPYPEKELADLYPGIAIGPWVFSFAVKPAFAMIFVGSGMVLLATWIWRSRKGLTAAFIGAAAVFALYVSWVHWRDLTPHWSQRDIFWSYFKERQSPDEPIVAFLMNWRGETFYSRNLVRQIQDNTRMKEVADRLPRTWVIVERNRLNLLRQAIGPGFRMRVVDRSTNKFFLVEVVHA